MNKYTSTPIKVLGFFLLISILFSCTKDSDLLSDYVLQDSIAEIEQTNADQSENPEEPASDQNENPNDPPSDRTIEVDFYVTTSGSASNDGLTEATAWNISHAFAIAKAGDVVAIKAGNYGHLIETISQSGTSQNPIKFIGYKDSPGDINASNGPSYTKDNWLANNQALPSDEMPLIFYAAPNQEPSSNDKALVINGDYIEFHNFMIQGYYTGLTTGGDYITLNNIIGYKFGNWDPNAIGWKLGDNFAHTNRNGYGFYIAGSNNCNITNCLIIDAGSVAYFFVNGGGHTIDNTQAYSYNPGNGSDYLFDLWEQTNTTVTNCYAERTYASPTTAHKSRAIILQSNSTNNLIENFTSINGRIQVENSRNNVLRNFNITGTGNGSEDDGSIQISIGSDDNEFYNFTMKNCGGISFLNYDENGGEGTSGQVNNAGKNNYFVDFEITDMPAFNANAVFNFHRLGTSGVTSGPNYIIRLTADNFSWLISASTGGGTVDFSDCTFTNGNEPTLDTYHPSFSDARGKYTATFTNCTFSGNNFSTPSGN